MCADDRARVSVLSAWDGQHFSQRYGRSAAPHEHDHLQHRQSQEAAAEQRGSAPLAH